MSCSNESQRHTHTLGSTLIPEPLAAGADGHCRVNAGVPAFFYWPFFYQWSAKKLEFGILTYESVG